MCSMFDWARFRATLWDRIDEKIDLSSSVQLWLPPFTAPDILRLQFVMTVLSHQYTVVSLKLIFKFLIHCMFLQERIGPIVVWWHNQDIPNWGIKVIPTRAPNDSLPQIDWVIDRVSAAQLQHMQVTMGVVANSLNCYWNYHLTWTAKKKCKRLNHYNEKATGQNGLRQISTEYWVLCPPNSNSCLAPSAMQL